MQRKTLALAVTMALAATSFQASAQDARDQELAALKQQLAELAAKVQELEDRSDAQSDVNVDTATQLDTLANNSTKVETKGGIKVTSADKNFEASIGGRVHFDAYAFDKDVAATTDTTEFRRARLTLSGKAYGWEYKVEEDFSGGSNLDGIRDLYIARNMMGGKVTIGHFKPYRALEELTSSKETVQNLMVLRFGNAIFEPLWRAPYIKAVQITVAETVGLEGRATWAPINDGTTAFHLGASYSFENLNKGTPTVTAVSHYAGRRGPSQTMATTTAAVGTNDSQVSTYGLEAAYLSGPFFVQSEYARGNYGQASGGSQDVDAFYVQGSWMLNGGMKAYKPGTGVFGSPKVADKGLWELTARWDTMENNDLLDTKTTSTVLGVNYYVNPNMRIMLNWTQGDNDKTGDEPSQLALRTQFAF